MTLRTEDPGPCARRETKATTKEVAAAGGGGGSFPSTAALRRGVAGPSLGSPRHHLARGPHRRRADPDSPGSTPTKPANHSESPREPEFRGAGPKLGAWLDSPAAVRQHAGSFVCDAGCGRWSAGSFPSLLCLPLPRPGPERRAAQDAAVRSGGLAL